MKILIASLGTYGDLNPVLGLAEGLQERGHAVTIATNNRFKGIVSDAGAEYFEIIPDFTPRAEEYGRDPNETEMVRFKELVYPTIIRTFLSLEKIISNYDVFISNSNIYTGYYLASVSQVPWIQEILSPYSTGFPPRSQSNFPAWLPNVYELIEKFVPESHKAIANLMSTLDKSLHNNRTFPAVKNSLRLCMFSKYLCGAPDYWGTNIEVTGFIFRDGIKTWPRELQDFLAQGEPPIAVTTGTALPALLGLKFYDPFIKAAKSLNKRLVILAGDMYEKLKNMHERTPNVLIVEEAQNSRLFPQCALIIHHGGIGTLAEAIRARAPSLIIPNAYDQPFNALHAEELHVGHHLLREDCTEENTTSLITALLNEEKYKKGLASLSEKMAKEDGIKTACGVIEAFVRKVQAKEACA